MLSIISLRTVSERIESRHPLYSVSFTNIAYFFSCNCYPGLVSAILTSMPKMPISGLYFVREINVFMNSHG